MKKTVMKVMSLMLVLSMMIVVIPNVVSAAKKTKVALNYKKVTLTAGKTKQLKVKGISKKQKVKWSSSNKKVATVTNKGKIKAVKKGSAKVTAKVGKKKYVCKVTVNAKAVQVQKPTVTPTSTPVAPTITVTPTPVDNRSDREKLQGLIDELNKNGASVPTDLDDDWDYEWDEDGNLVIIRFYDKNISGILDVSIFKNLRYISCMENNITSLIVSGLENLNYIICEGNNITSLDLSGTKSLEQIRCERNNITELDLSEMSRLSFYNCDSGVKVIEPALTGEKNLLKDFFTELNNKGANIDPNIYSGDYSWDENANLIEIRWTDCGISGVLDVSKFKFLKEIRLSYNNLTSLNISGLEFLRRVDIDDSVTLIESELKGDKKLLKDLIVALNANGASIDTNIYNWDHEWDDNGNLTSVYWFGCDITGNIDLSIFKSLINIEVEYNDITSLNVSGLTSLTRLYCRDNNLESLDLSGATSLRVLNCTGNSITDLDIRGITSIRSIYCDDGVAITEDEQELTGDRKLLKELIEQLNDNGASINDNLYAGYWDEWDDDFNLIYMPWSNSDISGSLDLSVFKSLEQIDIYNNNVTSLNVNGLTSLWYLECENNKITELDLRGLSVEYVYCDDDVNIIRD